jgi:hypothetical protein
MMNLDIANNDLDRLTLTDISIGGASVYSTSTVFNSGQRVVVNATVVACGTAGTPYTYDNVVFTYSKGTIAALKQTGTKALVGKCS